MDAKFDQTHIQRCIYLLLMLLRDSSSSSSRGR